MADCAGVTANAFQKVFPGTGVFPTITLAKYDFHVHKGLEDNSHRFKSSQHFAQFVADSKQQVLVPPAWKGNMLEDKGKYGMAHEYTYM